MSPLLCALLASAAALSAARADLAAGRPAQVLIDLASADAIGPGEAAEAGRLLTSAAESAKASGDAPLAIQLAQRASRADQTQPRPLQLLAEWSLADHEFDAAHRYGEKWSELVPHDQEARRFLKREEELERSWQPPKQFQPQPARPIRAADGARRRAGRPRSPGDDREPPPPTSTPPAGPASAVHRIILYGDTRSRSCEEARKWLRAHQLAFTDRDLDSDRRAALELKAKERTAGGGFRGLPMVEIDGRLLAGFSPAAWEAALSK